jgi:hypothetical protein
MLTFLRSVFTFETVTNIIGGIAAVAAVAYFYMNIRVGQRKDMKTAQAIAAADERAAVANRMAAEANERAGEANRQAAELNKRAADAELAMARLRKQQEPRTLEPTALGNALRSTQHAEAISSGGVFGWRTAQPDPSYRVRGRVYFRPDDEVAFALANRLHLALHNAGWDVESGIVTFPKDRGLPVDGPGFDGVLSRYYGDGLLPFTGAVLTGVAVVTRPQTYQGSDAINPAVLLADALTANGIAARAIQDDVTLGLDFSVHVFVGQKP